MIPRIMFDTGALVALERNQASMRRVHRAALEDGFTIVVITPVIAEWWRKGKREKERAAILRTLLIEPPDKKTAQLAGEAVGAMGAGVVDALVMACASVRGDTVYTSDVRDMEALQDHFRNVEVARV